MTHWLDPIPLAPSTYPSLKLQTFAFGTRASSSIAAALTPVWPTGTTAWGPTAVDRRADPSSAECPVRPNKQPALQAAMTSVPIAAVNQDTLHQAVRRGCCALSRRELIDRSAEQSGAEPRVVAQALRALFEHGQLIQETIGGACLIYTPAIHTAEVQVPEHFRRLRRGAPQWPSIPSSALAAAEQRTGLILSPSQRRAVTAALTNKVIVITGKPGTGKTAVLRVLLAILNDYLPEMTLCSPTGHAARRLEESTQLPASTLHRLLLSDPLNGFQHTRENPLGTPLVVAGEMSMMDLELTLALLEALPDETALILVGDVDQLASIGAGAVARDVIESGVIPVARLVEPHRQAAGSLILSNAERIRQGLLPVNSTVPGADFESIEVSNDQQMASRLEQLVCEELPRRFQADPRRDIQVLTPMWRGLVGSIALNQRLQQRLNPPAGLSSWAMAYRCGYTTECWNSTMTTS